MISRIEEIAAQFQFEGSLLYEESFGCGHINDTRALYYKRADGSTVRYILQRINRLVFRDVEGLMNNIDRVTAHIARKVEAAGGNVSREVLHIIRTRDDRLYYCDGDGECYRAYSFIEDASAFQSIEEPEYFYQAARAFGRFQNQLGDFPADILTETIPDFHNTKKRYAAFLEAVEQDVMGRAASVQREIEFVREREADTAVLHDLQKEGRLPLRVTHNDTKLNNVMIDNSTGKGLCVIDLDTVMPGLVHYDFGDSIRFGASSAEEDERDLSKVWMRTELFELYAKGFLEESGDSLTDLEIEYLPFSAKLLTLECGMRFLTDYLNGDTYFKIHREHQNLDRCRTQFKLVADMEKKMSQMQDIIARLAK